MISLSFLNFAGDVMFSFPKSLITSKEIHQNTSYKGNFRSSQHDALAFCSSFPPLPAKREKNKKISPWREGVRGSTAAGKCRCWAQRMEEAAVLSPCTKSLSSSISLARSCSPQRLFLILNGSAREWKSFRTCFVWVWFALFFFFSPLLFFFYLFLVMGSEMMQIKSRTRAAAEEKQPFALVCLPANTNNNNNK